MLIQLKSSEDQKTRLKKQLGSPRLGVMHVGIKHGSSSLPALLFITPMVPLTDFPSFLPPDWEDVTKIQKKFYL